MVATDEVRRRGGEGRGRGRRWGRRKRRAAAAGDGCVGVGPVAHPKSCRVLFSCVSKSTRDLGRSRCARYCTTRLAWPWLVKIQGQKHGVSRPFHAPMRWKGKERRTTFSYTGPSRVTSKCRSKKNLWKAYVPKWPDAPQNKSPSEWAQSGLELHREMVLFSVTRP